MAPAFESSFGGDRASRNGYKRADSEQGERFETFRYWALLFLVIACFLFGGASRNDVLSLTLLQPIAAACIAFFLFSPGTVRWEAIRAPLLLASALGAIIAVQLIPLPPSVWTSLPGHRQFAETAAVAGIAQLWRPLSLVPDLTLASLVGLVVPFAILLGMASVPADRSRSLLTVFIVAAIVSAALGLGQVAGGPGSVLYLYRITNDADPVGFMANRNHQGLLLALAWPMLALWSVLPADPRYDRGKRWIALAMALFLLPMIMATGSRAALLLGLVGLVFAALILRSGRSGRSALGEAARRKHPWERFAVPAAVLAAVILGTVSVVFSRDIAVQRLLGLSLEEEVRFQYFPTLKAIMADFFPTGAGFGTFDPVFRAYEPVALLQANYFNHAHNDLIEIVIEGGLVSLVLLGVFVTWLAWQARVFFKPGARRGSGFRQLGIAMAVMMLLASLADYPLRTPLMAALLAIACTWAGPNGGADRKGPRSAPDRKVLYP